MNILSICCITYNHEKYIAQTIEGFLMQKTDFEFNIIISDDCSTDNTREIIKTYADANPSIIQIIHPKKNVGMYKNFKHVLLSTNSKYIALCEGDDYWIDPYKLQKQVDFLESNVEYSFCCHTYINLFEETGKEEVAHTDVLKSDEPYEIVISNFLDPFIIRMNSIVFRNNIDLYKVPTKGFKDTFLFAVLLAKGKGVCLSDVMSVYRIHKGGIWSTKRTIELYKGNAETAYTMAKYFKNTYHSIDTFALHTLNGYLEKLYEERQSIFKIITISIQLIQLFPNQYTAWHKKQMLKRIWKYFLNKK